MKSINLSKENDLRQAIIHYWVEEMGLDYNKTIELVKGATVVLDAGIYGVYRIESLPYFFTYEPDFKPTTYDPELASKMNVLKKIIIQPLRRQGLIKVFIENFTNHKEIISINEDPTAEGGEGYVVKVKDYAGEEHEVWFWLNDIEAELAYGIKGWGVCTVRSYSQLYATYQANRKKEEAKRDRLDLEDAIAASRHLSHGKGKITGIERDGVSTHFYVYRDHFGRTWVLANRESALPYYDKTIQGYFAMRTFPNDKRRTANDVMRDVLELIKKTYRGIDAKAEEDLRAYVYELLLEIQGRAVKETVDSIKTRADHVFENVSHCIKK